MFRTVSSLVLLSRFNPRASGNGITRRGEEKMKIKMKRTYLQRVVLVPCVEDRAGRQDQGPGGHGTHVVESEVVHKYTACG